MCTGFSIRIRPNRIFLRQLCFFELFDASASKKTLTEVERAAAERVKLENPTSPELGRLGFRLRFLYR